MRKLRCCVIDDEPLALGLIKSYVEQTPFLEFVDGFQSASLGIKTILDGNIDLVFLDIQMAELNGIEFARVIPAHCTRLSAQAGELQRIPEFGQQGFEMV